MVHLFIRLSVINFNLADSFITRRSRKGNFLNQLDQLGDWTLIEETIAQYYAPVSDIRGLTAYPGLLLFKCCWSVSDMTVSVLCCVLKRTFGSHARCFADKILPLSRRLAEILSFQQPVKNDAANIFGCYLTQP